jgi:hypothetical protein
MPSRLDRAVTPALDALLGDERGRVLAELLAAHPELKTEAEQAALRVLRTVTVEGVADDVSWELDEIPMENLAARSGRVRGRGYVHETEAAWELVSEAVEPFLSDVRRRVALGLTDAAVTVVTGIVAGLYQSRDPADGTVVAYAGPDALTELADEAIREATQHGVAPHEDAAEQYWPQWTLG